MLRSSSSYGRNSARRIWSSLTTKTTTDSRLWAARPRYLPSRPFASSPLRFSSSFADPGTLFNDGDAITNRINNNDVDKDAPLRADIRAMGALLGQIVHDHEGQEIFEKIEELRGLSKQWRTAGAGRIPETADEADATFAELTKACSRLSNEEILVIARAFNFFLSIANAAEGHHRIRRLNMATREEALPDRYDSCGGVLKSLVEKGDHSPQAIYDALIGQTVELVLTAHPTEVNRRTILRKQEAVQKLLTKADYLRERNLPSTGYAQSELDRAMKREIASTWQTDEVAREKPTPQKEAERGTLVVETVLWDALPAFLRRLNSVMNKSLGKNLPLDTTPVIFSSWMGGDRDGNPNVTPDVTREVNLKNRAQAAGLLARDLERLRREMSLMVCNDEIRAMAGETKEPYRAVLSKMKDKMNRTKVWAEEQLEPSNHKQSQYGLEDVYTDRHELIDELMMIYRSLCETDNEIEADGFLTDVIRNVHSFGLTMVTLDIRQESDRHEEAIDAITRYLGLGSYSDWDEETKLTWLQQQLASPRPLIRSGEWNNNPRFFSPTAVDTLETFTMIAEQHEGSLGAYVISQATSASDVLAVLVLQKDAGVKKPLRVAPLFETLDDLNGAASTMKKLFSLPGYMGAIDGKQEVMIGYSDSAKDAGRLAASWAQYETQEALAKVARDSNVEMTFFHGKGGTVGRGGNPQTFQAILAHAPDTINGRFRVTEQGEMITQNFGYQDRAERTMDIYTAAVLAEKLTEHVRPTEEWRGLMKTISDVSCESYRRIVSEDERFVPYFRSATPELELSNLNIGSRPAKRKPTGGVESLRAIPWNFSWTQTRLNLPTWLGVGEAFEQILASKDGEKLREMYKEWPSFRTTVDMVEMVLAKSEPKVAQHYDSMLVSDEKAKELGVEIRSLHAQTEEAVLNLTGHEVMSEDNEVLIRLLGVRNRYVDVLNCLQTETLKRIRKLDEDNKEDQVLKDCLLSTITGVANGMGNTG